jgi:hypothetical protein
MNQKIENYKDLVNRVDAKRKEEEAKKESATMAASTGFTPQVTQSIDKETVMTNQKLMIMRTLGPDLFNQIY